MDFLNEKISYLRGLCDGAGFDKTTKEGKIFNGILDILDEMSDMLQTMEELEMEEDFPSLSAKDEEEEYTYSFICPNCEEEIEVDSSVFDTEEEIECPNCGTAIPVVPEAANLKF